MRLPYQPSALLVQDNDGDAECIVIEKDAAQTNTTTGRVGRRGRLGQRKSNASKKAASAPSGEKEFQELIRLCEYEVNQDIYRGMGFLGKNGMAQEDGVDTHENANSKSDKIITPWDICQWGILSMPKTIGPHDKNDLESKIQRDSVVLDSEDPENLVRNLTESFCPAIRAWTKDYLEESNRKKQQSQKTTKKRNRSSMDQNVEDSNNFPRLGLRPSNTQYRCPCDANPFCLGSMGGVVNSILTERCQQGITISIIDEDEKSGKNEDSKDVKRAKVFGFGSNRFSSEQKSKQDQDDEVEVVDVDQTSNTETEEIESLKSSTSSIFEFMGKSETLTKLTNKAKSLVKDKSKGDSQTSVATTASCERLGPRWSKPEIGEPAEVFSSSNYTSSQPFDEEGYSQVTKEELKKLRGAENVDISTTKLFIQKIFELSGRSDPIAMTMDEYIRTMTEWHKSLIFVNPTIEKRDVTSDKLTIALPPGISNLGATCYLNTQLQCLAQIPVFLDGIFKWRPVNSSHKMNGVMTKLQKLLAQMLVGGDGKYTSLDFSNALGIQHNEQQDPNEFARLLFDRMEESFQQCSNNNDSENVRKGGDLGKLLHRIFHGTTTYETICMKCGNTSVRSEGFMDLNLPIVHREYNEDESDDLEELDTNKEDGKDGPAPAFVSKRKRRKKGVLEKAFERQKRKNPVDTDVQYCFDQYTKAEMLEGDNQYFCDSCNCKQDAKRVMSLTELPPVLNIQLSRYVFDREKFIKKKLTDKVRLPTILTVNQHQSASGGKDSSLSANAERRKRKPKKKYVLCAVMKHRGTSAYSGHYIAEAMDWTIGQWYEFNDEIVKVLSMPSNSYVPYNADEDNTKNEGKSAGSEDAYNMYYVDEEYLAENAIATMSRNKRLTSTKSNPEKTDVLNTLIREKAEKDSVLTELCYADYAIAERLRRRKDGIRKYMFVDPSSLLLQEGQPKDEQEPYFWVDGNALRQFLSCDRSLDDKLKSSEPIVCPESLICSHGCLHPQVARCGKLLRKSIYDNYIALLSAERKYLSEATEVNESDVVGRVVESNGEITCGECSQVYREELSKRLEFLRNIYDLYLDVLDETKDLTKSGRKDSTEGDPQEEYAFIVSRSTITKFKKLVLDLMKSVADFERGGDPSNGSAQLQGKRNPVLEGVDDLNLSSFPGSQGFPASLAMKDDQIDAKFNSKITCSHGNCNDFSLRIVRFVSFATWAKIRKVFPDAIEQKILLSTVDGTMRKPNIEDDGCVHCRAEKDAINNLKKDVEGWAKETKSDFALKKLLDGKKISVGEIAIHNFDNAQNNCRLVHRDDITNFCQSVRLLGRLSRSKLSELSEIKSYVENIAFPSYHRVVLDFEKQPHARLLQSIRSLTCCEHKRVIKSAIIDSTRHGVEQVEHRCQLSNSVAVLSDEEYNSYINALSELLVILNRDYHQQEDEKVLHENPSASTLLEDVNEFSARCHPAIRRAKEEDVSSDELLLFSLDGNSKEFSIIPGFCDHETCKKDYAPSVQKDAGVAVDSVSVDSTDAKEKPRAPKRKLDSRLGSVAMSPIIVESDLEDDPIDNRLKLRVFQHSAESGLIEALESLKSVVGTPNSGDDAIFDFGLRRSSRKRKTKFPIGCITGEHSINIGLHHNVAALRLLLFQDCQTPLGCNLSVVLNFGDDSLPKGHDIAFDESTKTLNELVDKLKSTHEDFAFLSESNLSEHLFLLYRVDKDDKSGDIEATLMDSLLQASNIESANPKGKPAKKKRNRSLERGFQGSLLQSSSIPLANDRQNITDDDDDSCQIDESKEESKKENKYKAVISEDEFDDLRAQIDRDMAAACSSDEEEVAIIPSPPPRAPAKSEIGDEKRMEIVCRLMELTELKDESRCFEAVSWVIKSNPKYDEAEVINAALTRIFDNSSS